jgi:hypothetical protein
MTDVEQTTRVVDDIRTFFDTTQTDPEACAACCRLRSGCWPRAAR